LVRQYNNPKAGKGWKADPRVQLIWKLSFSRSAAVKEPICIRENVYFKIGFESTLILMPAHR
jgi:hypothetical protein